MKNLERCFDFAIKYEREIVFSVYLHMLCVSLKHIVEEKEDLKICLK